MEHEQSFARLTLSLDIIRRLRKGPFAGYHQIRTVKQETDLFDMISVRESREMGIICDNPGVPNDERNLCWKAAEVLKKEYGIHRNATISIEKRIPVMGGLAGGSSNAAATLRALSRLWKLGLRRPELMKLGKRVGMDVPYYFIGGTAEDDETQTFPNPIMTMSTFTFLLIRPPVGISTAQAYSLLDYAEIGQEVDRTDALINALQEGDEEGVFRALHNDFEQQLFSYYPVLQSIKMHLLGSGCPSVLSGSGSTLIAICDESEAESLQRSLPWESIIAKTR